MKHFDVLNDLRSRELEQRQTALAQEQQLHARVAANVERLGQLASGVSVSAACAGQALNSFAYKQSLFALVESQQRELARREAQIVTARQAVIAAARDQQVIEQLHQQAKARARIGAARAQQKVQDDLATQVWLRGEFVR